MGMTNEQYYGMLKQVLLMSIHCKDKAEIIESMLLLLPEEQRKEIAEKLSNMETK